MLVHCRSSPTSGSTLLSAVSVASATGGVLPAAGDRWSPEAPLTVPTRTPDFPCGLLYCSQCRRSSPLLLPVPPELSSVASFAGGTVPVFTLHWSAGSASPPARTEKKCPGVLDTVPISLVSSESRGRLAACSASSGSCCLLIVLYPPAPLSIAEPAGSASTCCWPCLSILQRL